MALDAVHPDQVSERCRDYTKASKIAPGARTARSAAPQDLDSHGANLPASLCWPPALSLHTQDAAGACSEATARTDLPGSTGSLPTRPYETVRANSAVS
jgi:hypothetical protein